MSKMGDATFKGLSVFKSLIKEFEGFSRWISWIGVLGVALTISGACCFLISLVDLLRAGVIERVFIYLAVAGVLISLGSTMVSIVANKISSFGIKVSFGLSGMEKLFEGLIKVIEDKNSK